MDSQDVIDNFIKRAKACLSVVAAKMLDPETIHMSQVVKDHIAGIEMAACECFAFKALINKSVTDANKS